MHQKPSVKFYIFLFFFLVFCADQPFLVDDFEFFSKPDMKAYGTCSLFNFFNASFSEFRMTDHFSHLIFHDTCLTVFVLLLPPICVTDCHSLGLLSFFS